MKINQIRLNCRRNSFTSSDISSDNVLCFFRTPVSCRLGSTEKHTSCSSAAIMSGTASVHFVPVNSEQLSYDYVSFRLTSAEKQYIASMELPFDVPVELPDNFSVSSIMKLIKSHSLHRNRYFGEFMELAVRMILICMSESLSPERKTPEDSIPKFAELKALREAIYDDPMSSWSADEICEDMDISKTYFHRLYFAAFGVTCRQDVIESRLLYAAELLKNTDLSVSAIAEQCGYDSDSYFMKQFKQHKGCTPSEYRRTVSEYMK